MKNTVGNNLKRIREALNLTQEELALKCGLTQAYINFLESGKRGYTRKTIEKIAEVLNIPISQLFEEQREEGPTKVAELPVRYKEKRHIYNEIIDLLDKLPDSVIDHYKLLLKIEVEIRSKGFNNEEKED
jgi:transcriptional regulator with XRE-family HTH domain